MSDWFNQEMSNYDWWLTFLALSVVLVVTNARTVFSLFQRRSIDNQAHVLFVHLRDIGCPECNYVMLTACSGGSAAWRRLECPSCKTTFNVFEHLELAETEQVGGI
jgi:phage FluMu protein Com